MTPSSVCVVLIQEYNLLCSLGENTGLLETVEAAICILLRIKIVVLYA